MQSNAQWSEGVGAGKNAHNVSRYVQVDRKISLSTEWISIHSKTVLTGGFFFFFLKSKELNSGVNGRCYTTQ